MIVHINLLSTYDPNSLVYYIDESKKINRCIFTKVKLQINQNFRVQIKLCSNT